MNTRDNNTKLDLHDAEKKAAKRKPRKKESGNTVQALKRRPELSIFTLFKRFPTEDSVIEYFRKSRYMESVFCPHCKETHKISPKKNERSSMYQCNSCNNSFSIFKGTIFEDTKTDLRKWVYAILQAGSNAKKGLSACQLQRDIDVTYKCAWRMLKQVRLAMANSENLELVKTIVEIDETYIGGKPRVKGESKRGRGTHKIPVVGILDRNSGKVFAAPMMPNEEGQQLSAKQLLDLIEKKVHKKSLHVTDEFRGYNILPKVGRKRSMVNHSINEWKNEEGHHTNNIENFWSLVKRMHHGTYHHISSKYLGFYLAEQAFRYSNRFDMENIFDTILEQAVIGE